MTIIKTDEPMQTSIIGIYTLHFGLEKKEASYMEELWTIKQINISARIYAMK